MLGSLNILSGDKDFAKDCIGSRRRWREWWFEARRTATGRDLIASAFTFLECGQFVIHGYMNAMLPSPSPYKDDKFIVGIKMSHYQGDDGEYVADDYEAEDVDVDEEFHNRELADPKSDVDELDILLLCQGFLLVLQMTVHLHASCK
ncbi:hypothetical protein NL676_039903 [Syzygium grande]|nr:hypothetical protein NL676_039903 [Syzygium grande]